MKSVNDPRHNARKLALGALFCSIFSNSQNESSVELASELLELENVDEDLTSKILDGINMHREEIDEIISKCAPEWPIEKISKVDLAIMRMSVFEILYDNEIPDKVVIDEAVELAKEFGSDTSGKFVNGVLGTVVDIKTSSINDAENKQN